MDLEIIDSALNEMEKIICKIEDAIPQDYESEFTSAFFKLVQSWGEVCVSFDEIKKEK